MLASYGGFDELLYLEKHVDCSRYDSGMGRTPSKSGDMIAVNINGRGAAWCDGVFTGDEDIVRHAKDISEMGLPVYINGEFVETNPDTASGAFASLFSYNPDQAILVEAPDEVVALVVEAVAGRV